MKKEKWWVSLLKTIGLTALGMVINNQKGIKGTSNTETVNDALNELKKHL